MYKYSKANLDDHVFHFIYGCAMHDAILQKAFEGKKDWVGKVTEAEKLVKGYIGRILDGNFRNDNATTRDAHEKAFLDTANAVCHAINTSELKASKDCLFSFGNAQKLINMTVKHVYAHTYSNASIRECFRHCHCPLDSIMLSKVYTAYRKAYGPAKTRVDLGCSDDFHVAWGKEGADGNLQKPLTELPSRYAAFQTAIKALVSADGGDCFAIEFDYLVWKSEAASKM